MTRLINLLVLLAVCYLSGCAAKQTDDNKLAIQWRVLCKTEGILDGCHEWTEDVEFTYDTVLQNDDWQAFFARKPADTVPYLLTRLAETNETAIDVTPWGKAPEGTMAVYAIQYLLQTNWFRCPPSYQALARYHKIYFQAPRFVEPFVLTDIFARNEMSNFFAQAAIDYKPPDPEDSAE